MIVLSSGERARFLTGEVPPRRRVRLGASWSAFLSSRQTSTAPLLSQGNQCVVFEIIVAVLQGREAGCLVG